MEVPAYLLRIVSSYFLDRVLEFTTDDGAETYEVTAGVPQGSVLGPILWNVRIVRLKLPRSAKIVGFADDIAVTVVVKHLDLVEFYSNESIRLVRAALTDLGLQTADQKTEVLLFISRKVRDTIILRAGYHYITSAPCIRYLGVHIDARLRFDEHLRIVSDKANRVAVELHCHLYELRLQRATSRAFRRPDGRAPTTFSRISHRNNVYYTLKTTVFYVKRPQLSIGTIKNAKKYDAF
ncbi:unnamed protein product [Trichogramma brassicae]|uniref:Reverse transcriptase domain-containing protein n=1 Tax=Trichogramma brassicae TaxID=86971 RepID=A0A6H5HZR7_9HYME|nr:unnamed protein product [Trichogramma brassicae]